MYLMCPDYWAAIHYTHDTEGFYRQLNLVQKGIEQNSKLVLRNVESLKHTLRGMKRARTRRMKVRAKKV